MASGTGDGAVDGAEDGTEDVDLVVFVDDVVDTGMGLWKAVRLRVRESWPGRIKVTGFDRGCPGTRSIARFWGNP